MQPHQQSRLIVQPASSSKLILGPESVCISRLSLSIFVDKTFTTTGAMQNQSVDLGVLYTEGAENYFRHADRRIRAGYRAALEALSIPLPPYALRGAPGPNPAKALKAAYQHDNPERLPR